MSDCTADIDEPEPTTRFTPTIQQIAEECARIRAGWSEETERSRRAVGPTRELYFGNVVKTGH